MFCSCACTKHCAPRQQGLQCASQTLRPNPVDRLFLSAEPPPALERPLPISLLQASIKLTNEPPEGLKANLKRAFANFSEEVLESCAKQAEFRCEGRQRYPASCAAFVSGARASGRLGCARCSSHNPFPCPSRTITFALCYFHAALLERKKFGVGNLPGATSGIGWNMNYPFNTGDLLCCGQASINYLDNNVKVRRGGACVCIFVIS